LALTFGTLLSSQGTDASFVLTRETLSGFPPGFPFGLAFPTLSDLSDPISSALSRFSLSRFPFRRFRLYQKFRAGLTGRSFRLIGRVLRRIQ
ncbi:hypothetical protein ACFQ9U_25025, partial [Streptomyces sp. NPDC056568]|uniref:hypothetical protein n=1 Tax=Streptomyces sp. NPDC056568 TaxID=3345866 RepID=UPI0036AF1E64